jgi:beta-phosphoglucomutase
LSENMGFKGVIFDLDGVLVDSVPIHYAAWKRLFEEDGYAFDDRIYRQKVDGRPRIDGVRGVMGDLDEEAAIEAGNRKQAYYLEMIEQGHLHPFATSIPFIRALRASGILLAAASSSENTGIILDRIGVLADFTAVVTAADVTHGKPHPEIFLAAAQRLGLSISECVVFEDAESGIKAAKLGGFFCIGVDRHQQPEYFQEADLVINDLSDLESRIQQSLFIP